MGSRIREKSKLLFEVFVEVARPSGKDEAPFIMQQYPPEFDDKEALMMIPRFVYPCPTDASQVDHFTFVLTDMDSMFRFGYCRHTTGHQTCLCIVSWLPWCEIFYKMLDLLAEITNRSENNNVTTFLQSAYAHDVPLPKIPVTIVVNQDMFSFTSPDPNALPRIPGSRHLTEYYNAVDPNNMMLIFASMLHERRIYMTSKKLSRLTSCIHAAEALLYPMHWQHLYIPVLPSQLIDYISAPMPYVIGIHSNLVEKLKINRVDVGDAVVVDLDSNTVSTEYDDLGDLPEDVSSYLKRNLKTDIIKNSIMKTGDAISMAFLNALVRLIGGYRDALKFRSGEPITFDPESFVHSRPSQTTQAFLEGMLTLQIFQQFIYGRLGILNTGGGFKDIFEVQATLFADKLNSQSRYKEWMKSVKKSGKKGWNGLKVKVKEQGKKAMADFKTKLSGLTDNEDKKWAASNISGGVVHSKSPRLRPMTAHAGTLPRAPAHRNSTNTENEKRGKTIVRAKSIDNTHDDSQLRLSYHTMDMCLMTDSDIQAAMLRSASAEILSGQAEDSSTDSDTDSDSDGVDSNIGFDALHSSDEGLNTVPPNEVSTVQKQQDVKLITGDKLILTKPVSVDSSEPVAAPRRKKDKHASPKTTTATEAVKPAGINVKDGLSDAPFKTVTLQDAPLIKFDSSESEPTDPNDFDPLMSVAWSSDMTDGFKSLGDGNESNAGSRISPSIAIDQKPKEDSVNEIFDPFSDLAGLSFSSTANTQTLGGTSQSFRSDPLSSHSPRRDSADLLMHEWSLASLSKGHNMSSPRATQPLKMRYPNNPFILGTSQKQPIVNSSAFSSAPMSGGAFSNQGQVHLGHGQMPLQGLYLGQKAFDFQKVSQFGPRQPFRPSGAPFPNPRQLSASSYAPYSSQHSSMAPQAPGVMNFTAPAPSLSPASTHTQRPNTTVGVSSIIFSAPSTSASSSQRTSDIFTDLLDIDFGGKATSNEPKKSTSSDPSPHPPQPKWETFD